MTSFETSPQLNTTGDVSTEPAHDSAHIAAQAAGQNSVQNSVQKSARNLAKSSARHLAKTLARESANARAEKSTTDLIVDPVTAARELAWGGKPYFPISEVYKARFGQKVVKVPVSIADNCPNRAGLKGMKTCIFCDVHGSFAYPDSQGDEVRTQIFNHREKVAKRFNAIRFLVYFQAYTTTFSQMSRMKEGFEAALENDDVVGLIVGTRPDTLSQSVLNLWKEYSERTFVGIELGVQSFDDDQLTWMRRGHTAAQAIKGIERVAKTGVDVGVHLIFGWPTENDKQIIETARLCNSLPISNVKLHNLHVLKKTALEPMYNAGEFQPVDLELYSHRVALFLDHLDPRLAVHRLAALSNRWDELIAPEWTAHKMKSFQAILDYLKAHGSHQGRLFNPAFGAEPLPASFGIAHS